jgi:hypothetical protein
MSNCRQVLLVFLGLWLALRVSTAFGESLPAHQPGDARSSRPKSPSLLSSLLTVNGSPVEQDPPGERSFRYVHPNEARGFLFDSALDGKGALISVGSFRGLNNASSGNVRHLIQLDYNYGINLFNLVNAQLIAQSNNRFEYLSLLFTGELNGSLIRSAQEGKLTTYEYILKLVEPMAEDLARSGDTDIVARWRKRGVKLPTEEDWQFLRSRPDSVPLSKYLFSTKMTNYLRRFETENAFPETIFGNDTRFNTIRNMIRDGRVTVLTGDIVGSKSFASLGTVLRRQNVSVAAVDVSNILDYFAQDPNNSPRASLDRFESNLQALPLSKTSRVFATSTSQVSRFAGAGDEWAYFVVRPADVASLRAAFPVSSKRDGSGASDALRSVTVPAVGKDSLFVPMSDDAGR